MPIIIPDKLPAHRDLRGEEIFLMNEQRAIHQDIRPLRILLLNLMPDKITTETQIIRLLSNSPLQMELFLLRLDSYTPKNTSKEHLFTFYSTFDEVRHERFDGMIITGAPVEHMDFEEVTYWKELGEILDWKQENVTSCIHICWGAQAALYRHYGIPKVQLDAKAFGVFPHKIRKHHTRLLRGFDDPFFVPVSRHTGTRTEDVKRAPDLEIVADSDEVGLLLVVSKDGRQIYVTGHFEYDPLTLKNEYERDLEKGLSIHVPENYFAGDDPGSPPMVRWKSHAHLLYSNWVNYHVYQQTPFDLHKLGMFSGRREP